MEKIINDVWELTKKHSNAGVYVAAMLLFSVSKQLRSVLVALLGGKLGDSLVRLDVIVSSIVALYLIGMVVLLIYADVTKAKFGWGLVDEFNACLTVLYNPVLMWMQLFSVVYVASTSVKSITALMSSFGWLTWLMAATAIAQGLLAFLMLIAKKN